MAATKTPVDITREISSVRNSALPGANFQATALSKIQLGFRDLQNQVQAINTQQAAGPSLVVTETNTNYAAKYTDNIIISTVTGMITVTFPVDRGHFASWFVLCSGGSGAGPIVLAATSGQVLGATTVTSPQLGLVVSDGNNLICAGGS